MANKTIHELTPASTVSSDYQFAVYDVDGNTTKKASVSAVLGTEDLLYADDDASAPDTDVEFTTADTVLNPAATTATESIALFGESDTWSTKLGKISQLFKNVRIILSKLGTTDISSIGNGTVTDALSTLNDNAITVPCNVTKASNQSNLNTDGVFVRRTGHVVSINGFVSGASVTANTETNLFTIDNSYFRPPNTIRSVGMIGSQAYGTGTLCYISIGTNGTVAVTSSSTGTAIRFNITYIING